MRDTIVVELEDIWPLGERAAVMMHDDIAASAGVHTSAGQ